MNTKERYIVYKKIGGRFSPIGGHNWRDGVVESSARYSCAQAEIEDVEYRVEKITRTTEDHQFDDLTDDIERINLRKEESKQRELERARRLIVESDQ